MPKNKPKYRKNNRSRPKYIENAEELEQNSTFFHQQKQERHARRKEAGASESESEGSDEESDEEDGGGGKGGRELESIESQLQRRAAGKAREKLADNLKISARSLIASEGLTQKKRATKMKDLDAEVAAASDPYANLTRKEREKLEAEKRKAIMAKKYAAGLTEEAKKDRERLLEARARRAAAQKRREQEKEEAERKKKEKKEKSEDDDDGDAIQFIETRTIKKMKPPKLKEELKKRGCDIQGNKKQLIDRLIKWQKENPP